MKVFDSVPVKVPSKNVFNLSHDVKASYGFDNIYPFLCQPVYPGETWNCRAEVFLRAMPMLAPMMHNVDMRLYFFFVPNRLVWNQDKTRDWRTFITGGEDGTASPTLPYFTYGDAFIEDPSYIEHRSLLDHLGFPTVDHVANPVTPLNGNLKISSLPLRAYQLVWNEYFRNQNVQNEIAFSYDAGVELGQNLANILELRKKNWEKDYFTSCLPFEQRGVAMTLPMNLNVQQVTLPVTVNTAKVGQSLTEVGLVATQANATVRMASNATESNSLTLHGEAKGPVIFTGLNPGTINDFRYCLRLQQWLENNARCGSRYIEQIFAHFGVRSSDARLQRPELLGGGKIPLIFTDVPQTSYGQGVGDDAIGNLGGKGTLYGKTGGFKKFFEEHGILLGLCCIIPRTSYSQGVPRWTTAFDKTDWYFPEFAHLGEQAVLNKELYYDPLVVNSNKPNDGVFGYQGRFTELRYIPSTFHGEMRSDLQYWHMGMIFQSTPTLNSSFVEAQSRANIWALQDLSQSGYDPFVCQMHLDIKAVRPIPKYAVPTL